MFKPLSRIICLIVFAVITFIALSSTSGGEKFRWLGTTVKEESEKVMKGIEKTKRAIDNLTGKKDEKSR